MVSILHDILIVNRNSPAPPHPTGLVQGSLPALRTENGKSLLHLACEGASQQHFGESDGEKAGSLKAGCRDWDRFSFGSLGPFSSPADEILPGLCFLKRSPEEHLNCVEQLLAKDIPVDQAEPQRGRSCLQNFAPWPGDVWATGVGSHMLRYAPILFAVTNDTNEFLEKP